MTRGNHTDRVKYKFGSASIYKCVDCGSQASDWSQKHGTRGDNSPESFEPRCHDCHVSYDYEIYRARADQLNEERDSPEGRAHRSEMAKANWNDQDFRDRVNAQWTQEKREARRQETIAANKVPISDERRKKLSESHTGKPWSEARWESYYRRFPERR
jgi:hypothetical protein